MIHSQTKAWTHCHAIDLTCYVHHHINCWNPEHLIAGFGCRIKLVHYGIMHTHLGTELQSTELWLSSLMRTTHFHNQTQRSPSSLVNKSTHFFYILELSLLRSNRKKKVFFFTMHTWSCFLVFFLFSTGLKASDQVGFLRNSRSWKEVVVCCNSKCGRRGSEQCGSCG
jgi:hypothetical protein